MNAAVERLRPYLERLDNWYRELQLRERVLVLAAACGVVVALWDALLLRPLEADIRVQQSAFTAATESLRAVETEQAILSAQLMANPNQALQQRIDQTLEQVDAVGRQLVSSAEAWVSPGRMVEVLRVILKERQGVRLLSLESLPPRPLGASDEAAGADGPEDIYEHTVAVTLEADYFSLLAYIEALEASQWQFIWDQLEYEVTGYPLARVQLRLKTLSASPEVLEIGP